MCNHMEIAQLVMIRRTSPCTAALATSVTAAELGAVPSSSGVRGANGGRKMPCMGDMSNKHGDFTSKHGDVTSTNGDFTRKKLDVSNNN